MKQNLILSADGYKFSHPRAYPKSLTWMQAYFCSRGGKFTETMQVGLQIYCKMLAEGITKEDLEEAKDLCGPYGAPLFVEGWEDIINRLGGKLPLLIKAVPEGTLLPVQCPLFTVESTDPRLAWLPGHFETFLSKVYAPQFTATLAHNIKKDIKKAIIETSDGGWQKEIGFKLNDFGLRGATSTESAAICGVGHLANFLGSDNTESIRYCREFYGAKGFISATIPAMEHSTVVSFGKEHEEDAYRNMLTQYAKPGALVACVSDSYDIYHAVEKLWCGSLLQQVKDSGATVVIRPDSGDPAEVVVRCLKTLADKVGYTVNKKGYKVLPPYFRIIQGDGVDDISIKNILYNLRLAGFSVDNVCFGMGGALLQRFDRDTQRNAFKVCAIKDERGVVPVFKDPITDPGKRSKAGVLDLIKNASGQYETIDRNTVSSSAVSELVTVFGNGEVTKEYTLDEVRARADSYL